MEKETVLITGASAGIGRELAKLFAAEGSNLVLVARRRERLAELAASLQAENDIEAHVCIYDLADPASPQMLFDELMKKKITVDVLVNNAGFGVMQHFSGIPVERQLDMIQVNITSLTHLTRLFVPGMFQRQRGGVLNVASTAAFQAGPKMAVYYASKAYVLHFTEALAEEARRSGVTISCLAPGPTLTEFASVAGMESTPIFRMGPMEAEAVARHGYQGFRRGKVLVIPGWRNWLGAVAVRFAPRPLLRRIIRKMNRNCFKEPVSGR